MLSLLRRAPGFFHRQPLWRLALINAGLMALLQALGPPVLELELSFYASKGLRLLECWGPGGVRRLALTTATLDMVFPLAYAAFLTKAYETLCRRLDFEPLAWVARIPWAAAACDYAENLLTLGLALGFSRGESGAGWFGPALLLMSSFAALKWALVFISALSMLVAFFQSRWGWAFITCRFGLLALLLGGLPLIATSQGQDLLRIVADDATDRLAWSCALGGLLLWALSSWYFSRVLLMIRWPGDGAGSGPTPSGILMRIPRLLGSGAVLVVALAFARAGLWKYALGCLVLAGLFFAFVTRRRAWLGLAESPERVDGWRLLPPATQRVVLAAIALATLLLALFTLAPVSTGQGLGSVAIVFLFAANAVFAGSLSVVVSRSWNVPFVVLALVAAAGFSRCNDNHALRLTPAPTLDRRPDLRTAFEAWASQRLGDWSQAGKQSRPMPVFLVASEGGGIRAGYWSAAVLARLEDLHAGFGRQVFAISGVSGGSLGAATYVALLADRSVAPRQPPAPGRCAGCGALQARADHVLRQDFLGPVLGRLVAPDLLQWFVPFPVGVFDRARALEDSWTAAYDTQSPRFGQPFLSLYPAGEPAFELPALLLNGTHVKTGQRMLHAPIAVQQHELPEIWDLAALLQADVRLSTAVHDSARFAYVSPAGRLLGRTGGEYGHVVDGGYFENSGVSTLEDVLQVIRPLRPASEVQFVILYLCNSATRCWGRGVGVTETDSPGDLNEVFSPVRALLGARDARGSLALAEAQRLPQLGFVEFGMCAGASEQEQRSPVPLGWQLSEGMRARMARQVAGLDGALGNTQSEACVADLLAGDGFEVCRARWPSWPGARLATACLGPTPPTPPACPN